MKLNTEVNNIKNETKQLRDKCSNLENENIQIKNEINDIKEKETRLANDNIQLKNEINDIKEKEARLSNKNIQLKYDINELKENEIQLKNENSNLKKEISELSEKLNILRSWKEKIMINNLDSKIINGNMNYNLSLKKWINPSRKIKAELLYRLSENGDKFSTFHELCDNKGPTLTLFHVNDGNIVRINTPLSWESSFNGEKWKSDKEILILI